MVDRYTVWVGGIEVNAYLMPKEEAVELANLYRKNGYKDVHIELLKQKKLFINNKSISKTMTAVNVPTVAYITDDNRLSVSVDLNTLKGYETLKNGIKNNSDKALVQKAVDRVRDINNTLEGVIAGEKCYPDRLLAYCQEAIELLTQINGIV